MLKWMPDVDDAGPSRRIGTRGNGFKGLEASSSRAEENEEKAALPDQGVLSRIMALMSKFATIGVWLEGFGSFTVVTSMSRKRIAPATTTVLYRRAHHPPPEGQGLTRWLGLACHYPWGPRVWASGEIRTQFAAPLTWSGGEAPAEPSLASRRRPARSLARREPWRHIDAQYDLDS